MSCWLLHFHLFLICILLCCVWFGFSSWSSHVLFVIFSVLYLYVFYSNIDIWYLLFWLFYNFAVFVDICHSWMSHRHFIECRFVYFVFSLVWYRAVAVCAMCLTFTSVALISRKVTPVSYIFIVFILIVLFFAIFLNCSLFACYRYWSSRGDPVCLSQVLPLGSPSG